MKMRIKWKNFIKNTAIFCAMAVTYVTSCDFPCLYVIGEPEIPEALLKLKENKYRNLK